MRTLGFLPAKTMELPKMYCENWLTQEDPLQPLTDESLALELEKSGHLSG